MTRLSRSLYKVLGSLGLDPRKTLHFTRALPGYARDYARFKNQARTSTQAFAMGLPFPCLADRFQESGGAKGHYFHQDLLVASRVHDNRPVRHVDVGSRVDGFVAHVASFRPIEVIDIRPLESTVKNITFIQADLMRVDGSPADYCDSLSCLHALEHFGLGRYGDTLDFDGHLAGLRNLTRMLQTGGRFYLSVPIGPQRIEFNAHRIFSVEYMLGLLGASFQLDNFSYVDDDGDLHQGVTIDAGVARTSFGCSYGCGIFELTKR